MPGDEEIDGIELLFGASIQFDHSSRFYPHRRDWIVRAVSHDQPVFRPLLNGGVMSNRLFLPELDTFGFVRILPHEGQYTRLRRDLFLARQAEESILRRIHRVEVTL